MSESQHAASPGGDDRPNDATAPPLPTDELSALNGQAPSTDDTPTIISRTSSRAVTEQPTGDLRGRRLAHFELIEPIGVGGMAAVIRARDTQLDRLVALKILPPDMAVDPENIRRFHQEARSAARLDHENIARVFFCGEDQRLHFIAFEFVEGDNLRAILERRGKLPVAEAIHYVLQVAAGLAHAAQRGVVHRDIKPSNIIITPTGRAKLVDMGLARSLERQDHDLTQSGVTLGTFDYISPEQALEPREADVRSDIYSLGCTLYHVLTGQPPVPEGTAAKKLHHHQHVKPRDPRQLVPGLPDDAAVILDRMMAKRPQDRYQSPEQLVHHLLLAARKLGSAGPHIPEGVLSVEAALPPPPGGRPLLLAGMAAVLVVVLVVLLEVFNRTPAAPPFADLAPSGPAAVRTNDGTPVGPVQPADPPKDKPPPAKDKGPADPPPPTPAVAYDDTTSAMSLGEWLKNVPRDAPKDIFLTRDVDLSMHQGSDDIGLLLTGPRVTIQAKVPGRRPTIRFTHDSRLQGAEPWVALDVVSTDVTVRGVRVLVDGRAADVRLVGLRVRGPGGAASFLVDNCEFIQARAGRGQKRVASLEADAADGSPAELTLTASRFLSFQDVRNEGSAEETLLNPQFAGRDAVARDGRVKISAVDCAFGPHAADFRLQGGKEAAPVLALEHCSVLAAGPSSSAVFDVPPGAAVNLQLQTCLVCRPDGPAALPADGAALIRQADPDGVACFDRDSRYYGLDAYRVVGDDTAGAGWDAFKAASARTSQIVAYPPLKGDPLQPFREYNVHDDLAESHFAAAFQVVESRADLRVAEGTGAPVGVETLGGVNYAALLAQADQQARNTISKRRYVDPTQKTYSPSHVYNSLEEALSASDPGDEIVLRCDGPLKVEPIRLDKKNLQDVTLRPEPGRHPVLQLVAGRDRDPEPTLFRVIDGRLTLDGLEFLVQPDDDFRRQALVDLAGQGRCSFKNCLVTLDGRLRPATRLAVASLSDLGKAMMGPAADQPPQLNFDGCFVRGDGDLVACQASRPLDLRAVNTLAALRGSALTVEPAADAPAAPAGQLTMTLDRVTAYLAGNLIHLRPGKDARSLAPVRCTPNRCLFVAAARDPQALIHLDDSSADEKAVQKLVLWTPGDGPTVYGNYAAMLDETAPDEMMSMTTVLPEKWKSAWDNNTGTLLKPFRFAGPPPPSDSGSFAAAVPSQFRPPSASDCGADVGRLQTLLRPAGSADALSDLPEE